MGFYVPWVVNGSKHSARLFRRSLQLQVGAGSGVDRPGDLKVQALSVPGTGFRIAPGGGVAQSRDTSASSRESYGPILDAQLTVPNVPGTGSQSARRDLVILEITDPEMESVTYPKPSNAAGWQDGSNFVRITVIPDVDSMVAAAERPVKSLEQLKSGPYANVTGITLAAISWPKSTGTITNAMIEDLRQVHSPKTLLEQLGLNMTAVGTPNERITSTSAYPGGGQTWPMEFDKAGNAIDIPEWATQVTVTGSWSGVNSPGSGAAQGRAWVQIGKNDNPDAIRTGDTTWKASDTATNDKVIRVAHTMNVPAALRGTRQQVFPRVNRVSGTDAASLFANWGTSFDVQLYFRAVAR